MGSYNDRKKPRSIVRFTGEIHDAEKRIVKCMVVDMSVTGARIHLEDKSNLPQKFTLKILLFPDMPPISIRTRRVWRNRDLAGLHFEQLTRRDYAVLDNIIKIHRGELKQPEKIEKGA